jgi:hypothetical protein
MPAGLEKLVKDELGGSDAITTDTAVPRPFRPGALVDENGRT